jgi:hypothetical protein
MKTVANVARSSVLVLAAVVTLAGQLGTVDARAVHVGAQAAKVATLKSTSSPPKGTNTGTAPAGPRLNDPTLPRANFMGMITNVATLNGDPTGDPVSFTLELGIQLEVIHLVGRTVITGRSAEAVVEGLAVRDYAVVRATRFKGVWYATRIIFDVQPVAPLHLFSGALVRLSPDGKRLVVKPDVGKGVVVLRLLPRTRYHVDGLPVAVAPALVPAESLQVLSQRINGTWIAWDVYTKSTL